MGDTKQVAKLIARSWSDPAFKKRLMEDPKTVLSEAGVSVPEGTKVHVLENTPNDHYVVLPPKPEGLSETELSDRAHTLFTDAKVHADFTIAAMFTDLTSK